MSDRPATIILGKPTTAPLVNKDSRQSLIIPVLILLNLVAFRRVAQCGFINIDDGVYVTDNQHVLSGLSLKNLEWALTTTSLTGNWHPLTWLSLMLDTTLWGIGPMGYHTTNLILHLTGCVLLFLALRGLTGQPWRSGLVAALFGVHPLRVESVAWISERKDVLCGCFAFLTLIAYGSYVRNPSWRRFIPVILFFALGLLAKPILVTLPFLLLLLDYWPLNRIPEMQLRKWGWHSASAGSTSLNEIQYPKSPIISLFVEKIPLFLLSGAVSMIAYLVPKSDETLFATQAVPFTSCLANAAVSYIRYLGKIVWFKNLAVLYPYRSLWPLWAVIGSSLLLLTISILAVRLMRSRPWLAVGWFWFVGMLVPVIGLVHNGSQAMADRYTYFPSIGIFIMLAWSIPTHWLGSTIRRNAIATGLVGILVGLCAFTNLQVGYWRNSILLLRHTLAVTQNNAFVHVNLAAALREVDKDNEAIEQYNLSLQIWPWYALAHDGLGQLLFQEGDIRGAIQHYQAAIRTKSNFPEAHVDLGLAFARQGKIIDAIDQYMQAIAISPEMPEAHFDLAISLAMKGDKASAVEHFREAVMLRPDEPIFRYNWATVLAELGQTPQAIEQFTKVLKILPDFAEAHQGLGMALAQMDRFDDAEAQLREALRLRPDAAPIRQNLEEVLARHHSTTAPHPG